jgi:cell division protein FtsN
MEHQKIIWIILSVTVAAIIVLLGGLVLLKDEKLTVQTEESAGINNPMSRINAESYAFDYTRENYPLSGLEPTLEEENVTAEQSVIGEAEETHAKNEPEVTTGEAKEEKGKPKTAQPKAHNQSASYAPTASATPSKPRTVLVKEYWIQAGSYQDRNKAELLNDTLTAKGLPGRIMTKDVNGETYFRVRIGPYSIKKEAEKFLTWIKALKGMENSYISEVAVKRKAVN